MNLSILSKSVHFFGVQNQKNKAIEELGELITALAKEHFGGGTDAIIDEIADVSIMVAQLALIFGYERVNSRIDFKIDRLESMMIAKSIRDPEQVDLEEILKKRVSTT